MTNTWLVLLPTLLVLIAAFTLRSLTISLSIGIISAALIFCNLNVPQSAKLIIDRFLIKLTDTDTIFIFAFLLIIGAIVEIITVTGGAASFARKVTQKIKDSRAVETSSLLLSSALFIDDYLGNLTVGHIMRPLTDQFKIARAKLAFLVHSMTLIIVLIPVTSWSAWIISQIKAGGISQKMIAGINFLTDPFYVYLKTIPFIFYSFLMLFSIWFIVRKRISFGPMYTHEKIAQKTGNLIGGKSDKIKIKKMVNPTGSFADLLVPLFSLVILIICGILYKGEYHAFGGDKSLMEALRNNTDPFGTLFVSGSLALTISILFAIFRKKLSLRNLPSIFMSSTKTMAEPMIMILLSTTLGLILRDDLKTGYYIANAVSGTFNIYLLPFILFIVSAITGIATGTAWGTMALLMPITIPMIAALSNLPLPLTTDQFTILFPSLGAILSGAVFGNHTSPIADTTIMAASSSGLNPVDHAFTQFPYTIPAIICTSLSFLLCGLLIEYSTWISWALPIIFGISMCAIILLIFNKKQI